MASDQVLGLAGHVEREDLIFADLRLGELEKRVFIVVTCSCQVIGKHLEAFQVQILANQILIRRAGNQIDLPVVNRRGAGPFKLLYGRVFVELQRSDGGNMVLQVHKRLVVELTVVQEYVFVSAATRQQISLL